LTEVISVRFRNGCKSYYFDPKGLQVKPGQRVIVETASGLEYVTCFEGNHEVDDESVVQPLRGVVRIATENDRRTDMYNREREREAFGICEKKILAHQLDMKLIRVESNFDASKIIFFFTAEGRVDFRELVKDLATVFRARIELRQVGVRDEAKMLGGLGICGRPLCCSQFLDEFVPVSIKMAKTQNLSLNPTKISGTCGRLMCCLKYEQNAYEDAVKRMPKNDSFVLTPDGPGNVVSVDLLREEVKVRLDESSDAPKTYKGCELQILRNGKGSREGIEIPTELPARFVRPTEKEERPVPAGEFLYDFKEQTFPVPEEDEEKKDEKKRPSRRRSRRGGRSEEKGGAEKAAIEPKKAEKRPEKKAEKKGAKFEGTKAESVHIERITVKASGDLTAEKKAAADRKAGAESRRSRRGGRGRHSAAEKAGTEKKPAEKSAAEPKKAEKSSDGQSHRRHYRPRRRRGGSSGNAQE